MDKLRYALIGAGGNAEKKHIQGYLELHDVDIVAICDIDIDKASAMARQGALWTPATVPASR